MLPFRYDLRGSTDHHRRTTVMSNSSQPIITDMCGPVDCKILHPTCILKMRFKHVIIMINSCDRIIVGGHIFQQSPTCPRQVCVTNSLVLLLSPTQCKVSFRSYLQVIISRVVSSIWRITDWPDLSTLDTFRAWPRISSSLLLEWPWDIVLTLTRGWTIPIALIPFD